LIDLTRFPKKNPKNKNKGYPEKNKTIKRKIKYGEENISRERNNRVRKKNIRHKINPRPPNILIDFFS